MSGGLVVVNAAGPVEDRSYSPSMEWLVADLTRLDGLVCGPAPWCWDKVCGIPGSGSTDYQRRDWEPLYSFALPDRLPLAWSDNTAFGKPPVCGPGGAMSNRSKDGSRVNDPWKTASRGGAECGGRFKNGEKRAGVSVRLKRSRASRGADEVNENAYDPPAIANPGNVIHAEPDLWDDAGGRVITARVGGNLIGSKLAHHNEAPMSLAVAERFVCWYVPEDGIVLDPFTGGGTTCHAALLHRRRFIGCDLRQSQVELCGRRVRTVTPNLLPA